MRAPGFWSSSPLSLTPTIFNGIAINMLSPDSFTSVTIDPATNMAGLGTSNLSFTAEQIEVDGANLPFTASTVVVLDVNDPPDAPEPGTSGLMGLSLLTVGFVSRDKLKQFSRG
jgi:hypothetical protein